MSQNIRGQVKCQVVQSVCYSRTQWQMLCFACSGLYRSNEHQVRYCYPRLIVSMLNSEAEGPGYRTALK